MPFSLRRLVPALLTVVALVAPAHAQGKRGMPDPYLSPALDAVLMPITPAVKQQFRLPKAATGVVVASVQPGGVGEFYGLEPGQVISRVDGRLIRRPVDLDSIVAYGVDNDESLFVFDGLWKGRKQRTIAEIESDSFRAPVSFDRADQWPGYRGRGFDYARWYSPYSDRASSMWEETLNYVAAVIVTDIFLDALRSDQAVFYYVDDSHYWPYDEYYITEVDQVFYTTYTEEVYSVTYTEEVYETYYEETYSETYSEEAYYEEVVTEETVTDEAYAEDTALVESDMTAEGVTDDGMIAEDPAYDEMTAEDYGTDDMSADPMSAEAEGYDPAADEVVYDDGATDETAYDDGYVAEDTTYDEAPADEQVYDDTSYEEPVAEDQAYEEPVYDDQSYEEPVYDEPVAEEPVYDEPVYEEPAYEEPAYDDSGSADCGYDEDGNPLC